MLGRRRALGLLPPLLLGLIVGWGLGPKGDCPPTPVPLTAPSRPSQPRADRDLLFVGVMTAKKYLSTRASAVHKTWGKDVPGKIEFFSSEDSFPPEDYPYLPLVRLPGVDDSYPPQKKSFLMLQYMWERHGDSFEWFLRADDDVYIRTEKLDKFLRSIDSSKAYFIGQAGRGNQEEFGLLSLEYDENFCMGGPGVILSREVLARVAPHIRYCLKNLYTTHEDVELGRCVQKFAGVSCTWSYEMQTILYHNSSGKDAFTGNLKQKEVHRAITLHPVKQYKHLYRIHNYMQMLKIQDYEQQLLLLYRDVLSMTQLLNMSNTLAFFDDIAQFGQPAGLTKFVPKSESELIPWDFIQRSQYSTNNANPRRRIDASLKEGLDDVVREVMDKINMFSKQRGRVIDFKEILYGYHRYSPMYGADYILDMLLLYKKYRGRKMTVPVRRHAYLQQQFTGISMRETFEGGEVFFNTERSEYIPEPQDSSQRFKEVIENGLIKIGETLPSLIFPSATDNARQSRNVNNKLINFILPLSGRFETFKRFIEVFEEVCLKSVERVSLTVVLFPNEKEDTVSQTLDLINTIRKKYPYAKIEGLTVFENFARASALEIGASHIEEPNDLLFFIDVDIIFKSATLQRIRTNTIRKKLVYFPIVFSEFDPTVVYNTSVSPDHFYIDETTGYWRQYGFGIGSIYKTDLFQVGGFDTAIKGWGKEDVDLFEKVISSKNISIFRSVDPDLVHVFHVVECDPNLDEHQLIMCKASRADTYGSVAQLTKYVNTNSNIINKFLKTKS